MSENRRTLRPDSPDPDSPFGGAEAVPSVTVLLDRRRLQQAGKTPSSASAPSKPQIRSAGGGSERRADRRLDLLSGELIARGNTPELQVLRRLFAQQADWAVLFLKQDDCSQFLARAVAGGSRERWAIWTGMRLGPEVSQDLWRRLEDTDCLDLTLTASELPSILPALGCQPAERVWIFWVGPRSQPLALLMAGGKQLSLQPELIEELVKTL